MSGALPDQAMIIADEGATRVVARLALGELLAYDTMPRQIHADTPPQIGDIYLVRMRSLNHNAYFVDLGGGQSGFLEASAVTPHAIWLGRVQTAQEGACLLATVMNIGGDGKQTRLSAKLQFFAPSMILTVQSPAIIAENSDNLALVENLALSRQISPPARREELRQMLRGLISPQYQILLRTVAAELPSDALMAEYHQLGQRATDLVTEAQKKYDNGKIGRIKAGNRLIPQAIENFRAEAQKHAIKSGDVQKPWPVIVQDGALLSQLKSHYSQEFLANLVEFIAAPAGQNLLTHYGVTELYHAARDSRHEIDKAVILIDARPMAVLIDIDRGGNNLSPVALNLALMPHIRRLIGVRGLSGLILIDFLRMKSAQDRNKIDAALRAASPWGQNWDCHGFTHSGLYEITVKR
ncbi:MAG: ribonuclease E/G [Alphaproteobacteria bacterium]|nr:ribonuclease E/G [Alphaproteobacteria bacterium]